MPPVIRVIPTCKRETGPCGLCEEDIGKGQLHATVCLDFGMGKGGRRRIRSVHLHFNNCLAGWVIRDWGQYKERVEGRKGGRPEGASKVRRTLEPEAAGQRHKLIRRHSWLLRKFTASEDVVECDRLVIQVEEVKGQIEATGVPIGQGNKRSKAVREATNTKWSEYHTGIAERRRTCPETTMQTG